MVRRIFVALMVSLALLVALSTEAGAELSEDGSSIIVEEGDTLSEIAVDLGVPVADLVAVNALLDPHTIQAGTSLALPPFSDNYPNLPDAIRNDPQRLSLVPFFVYWAEANGLPVDLVMAVAWQESGWQNDVVSYAGAVGIGQLMPATSPWIATDLIGEPDLDPTDSEDNIRMTARFLRWLIGYNGSEELAIAGYFQGPNSIASGVINTSTVDYVANVVALREQFAADS